jgi:1-acyl-sn-glycerol-3-phosphate acyltransferase
MNVKALYWFLKSFVVAPVLRLLFRPHVEGEEHIPRTGPVILAINHLAAIDSFFIPILLRRRISFLAKSQYFTGKGVIGFLTKHFLLGVGQLPIDRSGGTASANSLNSGLKALAEGNVLGIYPEGTRSPDGRLYRGKTGIARMALTAGVPVVPISIQGTTKIRPFPLRATIRVMIGDPIDFTRFEGFDNDRLILRSVTDEVIYEILQLGEQEYVDVYASTIKNNSEFDPTR